MTKAISIINALKCVSNVHKYNAKTRNSIKIDSVKDINDFVLI